jgi:hypothetical protein
VSPRTARRWLEDVNTMPQEHARTVFTALRGKLGIDTDVALSEVVEARVKITQILAAFMLHALPISQLARDWEVPRRTLHDWKVKGRVSLSHDAFEGWWMPVTMQTMLLLFVIALLMWMVTPQEKSLRSKNVEPRFGRRKPITAPSPVFLREVKPDDRILAAH